MLRAATFSLAIVLTASSSMAETPSRELSPTQRWRQDVRNALRDQATASEAQQVTAVLRLHELRNKLVTVDSLSEHMRVQLTAKIHRRLLRLREQIVRDIRVRQQRVARAKQHADHATIAAIETDRAVLAQWQDALGQFGEFEGDAGGAADNGEKLVELIETTICPDTWETDGGTGRIFYFSNLQALVVSAAGV